MIKNVTGFMSVQLPVKQTIIIICVPINDTFSCDMIGPILREYLVIYLSVALFGIQRVNNEKTEVDIASQHKYSGVFPITVISQKYFQHI